MCILSQITWIHPNGAQQVQQYPQFCERSINGQFCSPPNLVDRGQMPIPPISTQSQSSEDQEETQGITEEADDGPRRRIVGWVRSSSRRKKKDDPSIQRVLLRGATLEMGNIVEAGGRRRDRMWSSKLAMEEIPPRAPSPPYVPVAGYGEQYGSYQQFPQAMPQIQGYGRYPYNNMPPQPQYMAPQYGPGLPGQGYPTPQQQMLRHQADVAELNRLRHEHRQLDERYRQEDRRHRKLEAKLQSAEDEKDSVVDENKKLLRKFNRQAKDIQDERKQLQSWSQEMQRYIDNVSTMPDDLIRAKLSYAELKLEESRVKNALSGLHSRRRRGEKYGRREMEEEQLLEDNLTKTLRALRKLQNYIEDSGDSRFRGGRTRSTRKARETNAAAWADERQGRRRARSQDVRRVPLSSYTYPTAERPLSYSINGRVLPPPPVEPVRRHSRPPPPPPPPPAYMRNSAQSFKRRSSSTNSSVIVALTNSSGIGGSSTSTSHNHKDRDSSRMSSSSSASSQSSSGSSRHVRKDSKKAYVEDVFDEERGGFQRGRSPYVYLGYDGAPEYSQTRAKEDGAKKDKEWKKGEKDRKESKEKRAASPWVYK